MTFLRETWYAAALAEEVADRPFGRMICNERVVLYRDENGMARALEDRCPHRFVRLSLGRVEGSSIRCMYHGLRFGSDGVCNEMPFDKDRDCSQATIRAYPLVERYSVLWIWMGKPANADPALIPDFAYMDDPNLAWVRGVELMQTNYQCVIDNLLDLSHVHFAHAEVSMEDSFLNFENKIEQDGDQVWSKLWRNDYTPSDFQRRIWGSQSPRADGTGHVRWTAPANFLVQTSVFERGSNWDEGCRLFSSAFATPETETTTHYIYALSRSTATDDAAVQQTLEKAMPYILQNEDGLFMEAQLEGMKGEENFLKLNPLILNADAAGVRARRILQKLIREEQDAGQAQAAE